MRSHTRSITTIVAGLLIFGTCGFVLLEGWPVLDAFYMTVITLSTVGYGETGELSQSGRMFTAIFIGVSVVSMACWTASITSALVADDINGRFRKRQVKKMIEKMKNHVIICGGGLLARTIVRELLQLEKQVVVITDDSEQASYLRSTSPDLPIIIADPKSEMAIADANCFTASCIIAATDSDYDNLLITITGRGLGDQMQLISCAHTSDLTSRMLKVGANEIISPLVLGGEKAAELVA